MKLLAILLTVSSICLAEAPKVTVVQTSSVACALITVLTGGACMPTVVVLIEPATAGDKYLVGIRYIAEDGTETIESRYPVSGDAAWFFFPSDVKMLSATAASLRSNEVGVWRSPDDK